MIEYATHSKEETEALGKRLATTLPKNQIICLFGDLGAGKTTFVKGLYQAFSENKNQENTVNSPTFSYLNIYPGTTTIYHFDLYRLRDTDEFLAMGFDEYFFADGICCIEWSERILPLLPPDALRITLAHTGGETRRITIENYENKIPI